MVSMNARRLAVTALVLCCSAVTPAGAQDDAGRRVSVGLLGGGTLPVAPLDGVLKRGHHLGALVEVRSQEARLGLRFEATYAFFDIPGGIVADSVGQPLGELTGRMRLPALSANLVLRNPEWSGRVRPYIVGGVSVFRVHVHFDAPAGQTSSRATVPAETRAGVNAGLGIEVPSDRATLFGEARYYIVRHEPHQRPFQMIPLSLGLRLH